MQADFPQDCEQGYVGLTCTSGSGYQQVTRLFERGLVDYALDLIKVFRRLECASCKQRQSVDRHEILLRLLCLGRWCDRNPPPIIIILLFYFARVVLVLVHLGLVLSSVDHHVRILRVSNMLLSDGLDVCHVALLKAKPLVLCDKVFVKAPHVQDVIVRHCLLFNLWLVLPVLFTFTSTTSLIFDIDRALRA